MNEKADVALLRAKDLRSDVWANIRLGAAKKGEAIVAIGHPSLPTGDVNTAAVTQGLVSNPEVRVAGRSTLVADVSIASGSSGCPLISLETGEVVAVVQAVCSPGIKGEVASSGYTCLAGPAQRLMEWLGIRSGPR
jgi:Trypsin-like peptidase domain